MNGLRGVNLHLIEDFSDVEEFFRWLSTVDGPIGCDTETGGFDWWREPLRTIQIGDKHHGWTIPVDRWKGVALDGIDRWDGDVIFHNSKFDLHFLNTNGVTVPRHRVHDTQLAASLVDNVSPNALKSLAVQHVDEKANYLQGKLDEGLKNLGGWRNIPIDFAAYWQYAALDPVLNCHVWDVLRPKLTPYRELYDMELAVAQQLKDMEVRGIRVDKEYCATAIIGLEQQIADIGARVEAEYGVENPGSNPQIIRRLREDGVTLTAMTKKGNWKLDEDVLKTIDHPLAALVLQHRKATKTVSTYLRNFIDMADGDDILHASVNQVGAKTGRMSISRPSLQNLERSATVRDAFTASDEDHVLLLVDYDQIELRLLAVDAGVQSLIDAAHADIDLHTVTARGIYGLADDATPTKKQRQLTKNGTYAKLYGAGVKKFAITAGITMEQAAAFLGQYDTAYPEIATFQNDVQDAGWQRHRDEGVGYIHTGYGRRLARPVYKGMYVLVNYRIQGTASDVLKDRMLGLACEGLDQHLVLPVHDELIFDVPRNEVDEYERAVVEVMEERDRFAVPLTVDAQRVGRWGDKYREEDS